MDKRGFIKTVEAIIAVLLIFVFIYYITPKASDNKDLGDVKSLQAGILQGISENEEFRDCMIAADNPALLWVQGTDGIDNSFTEKIFSGFSPTKCTPTNTQTKIQTFIESSLPPKFQQNYRLVICNEGYCGLPPEKDTVYTSAVIITSSVKSQNYNPKIARLYIW